MDKTLSAIRSESTHLSEQPVSRLVSLRHWAEPAWAALCGLLASGRITNHWGSGEWLQLALLLLLVTAGWSTLWVVLSQTNWKTALALWRNWESGASLPLLPYAHPDSLAARTSRLLGQLLQWWREVVWPTHSLALVTLITTLIMSIVLSLLLGPDATLLNLAALALMELGMKGTALPQWDSLITITLPWIMGHAIFSSPPPPYSIGLALAFAITRAATQRPRSGTALVTGTIAQTLSAAILIVLQRPLAAGILLLFLMSQLLLRTQSQQGDEDTYARYTWPWLMAAMGIAAWAIREL